MKPQITPEQFKATILKGSTDRTAKPYVSKQRAPRKQNIAGLQASLERGI